MDYQFDNNELRAKHLVEKYQFQFKEEHRAEVKMHLKNEIDDYQSGSSEYLRFLCGYLFCIGHKEDLALITTAKKSINMDVGTMIDAEWLSSLENDGAEDEYTRSRAVIIDEFIRYYTHYFS